MAVKFQDYYATLGVARNAGQQEIQRAYRKLARQFHPDVNKGTDAEARFKQINEAYQVLHDPEKRQRYDALGENWREGQEFTPPPGWRPHTGRGRGGRASAGPGGASFTFGGSAGDFSDFFEAFFGRAGQAGGEGPGGDPFAQFFRQNGAPGSSGFGGSRGGQDLRSQVTIPLDDALHGGKREVRIQGPDGRHRTLQVKIPAGITDGDVIRLRHQGQPGVGGGTNGDLLLEVHVAPGDGCRVERRNLAMDLPIAPWEAALGAKVAVASPHGQITLSIPPGSQTGQKLRLRGKGLPARGGAAGDLLVQLKIVVPTHPTPREKELLEQLQRESTFDPRSSA